MQYIKISKELRTVLTPRELMLYAMIAAYVSVPNYNGTYGGLKNLLAHRTADGGFVFRAAWHALNAKGLLKTVKIPQKEHNNFTFRYELRNKVDNVTPSMRSLTAAQGRSYLARYTAGYTAPKKGYYAISREILIDPSLTFNDKWVWTCVADQLDLLERGVLESGYVTRIDLQHSTGFHARMFNTAWTHLQRGGYLQKTRLFDRQYGVTRCEYSLTSSPAYADPLIVTIDDRRRTHVADPLPTLAPRGIVETKTDVPHVTFDYDVVKQVVKENINYNGLVTYTHVKDANGFSYSKGDLDRVVARMVSAICCKKPTLSVNGAAVPTQTVRERLLSLDSGHVRAALYGMWKATTAEIRPVRIDNPRAYLLTVLFNSFETVEE